MQKEPKKIDTKTKVRVGVVVSDKMKKTIVVRVDRTTLHQDFGKVIRKSVKYKVHDEENTAKIGDKVKIIETRPLSRDKRWRLAEIIK